MLNIQIVSDIHIEFNNDDYHNPLDYIKPCADILVLAGDIGSLYKFDQLQDFICKVCKMFKTVIYVPGNWEFYKISGYENCSFIELLNRLYILKNLNNNLHILNRSSIIIDNICIIGCTLWSNLKIEPTKYYNRIHGVDSTVYNQKHIFDLSYIKKMINFCNTNNYTLVVVTHHTPTFKTLKKKNYLSSLYSSNLDYLLNYNYVHTWICGHTHQNFDFISTNGTRIVSNQKGKSKDNIHDYFKDFVVKI